MSVPTAYTEANRLREITARKLMRSLPEWQRLPASVVRLLVDELALLSQVKQTVLATDTEYVDLQDGSTTTDVESCPAALMYSDFSFAVAPAYKALEGFLLFLAETFGLPTEEYKHRIGGLYDWDENTKVGDLILKALESKLGTDREGKDRWRELGMVLRTYRHNPAHFGGARIETLEEATDYVHTIISTMNHMSKYLGEKGVLSLLNDDLEQIWDLDYLQRM